MQECKNARTPERKNAGMEEMQRRVGAFSYVCALVHCCIPAFLHFCIGAFLHFQIAP
jgi:hypothetical protein